MNQNTVFFIFKLTSKKKYSIILKLEISLRFTWLLLWFPLFKPSYSIADFNTVIFITHEASEI